MGLATKRSSQSAESQSLTHANNDGDDGKRDGEESVWIVEENRHGRLPPASEHTVCTRKNRSFIRTGLVDISL